MKVTDVRIRKLNSTGKLKARASITFDDEFVVHDIKIIDGQNGLFIAMPARKTQSGEFKDIAHPIKTEFREMLQNLVLEKFEEISNQMPEAEISSGEESHSEE